MIAQNAEFQAAAAEIDNAVRGRFGAESGNGGFAAKAGFLFGADDFQADAGGFFTRWTSVLRLRASREALVATARYLVTPYSSMISRRWTEGLDAFFQELFAEAVADEDAFAEPQGE